MKCSKCGTECPDGNVFCEACGSELSIPVLPENVDEKGRVKRKKKNPPPAEKKAEAPKPEKTAVSKEGFFKKLKTAGIAVAAAAAAVLIVMISGRIGANKGFNAAQSIPLGRNVEYAEAETKLHFTKKAENGLINSMSKFDYICVSEETVKVSGSENPAWVIMLTCGEDDIITHVEYYDFRQIKANWKGVKMPEKLTEASVGYGTSIRSVNKTLGMKPYYTKRSVSNDAVYCYRYFTADEEEGFDKAYNFYVEYSDVEMAVRNIHYSEIDYAGTILNAGNNAISYKIDITREDPEKEDEDEDSGEDKEDGSEEDDEDEDYYD